MKFLVIVALLFAGVVALGSDAQRKEPKVSSALSQRKRLGLVVITDSKKYKPDGKIKLMAMLTNEDYVRDVFVYGRLGWGYSSSFTYTIRDHSGKRVEPTTLADDLTYPIPRNDTSAFVKLPPDHFLGINYVEKLDQLSLTKPGKYSIVVEYHCPISGADVDLKNFWSKEDGTITSNVVWIEVVHSSRTRSKRLPR